MTRSFHAQRGRLMMSTSGTDGHVYLKCAKYNRKFLNFTKEIDCRDVALHDEVTSSRHQVRMGT